MKKANIAWSPSFNKWVFLDFGFARFLNEIPGMKTITRFRGTYQYTMKEMKNLYHLNQMAFVDLFCNDLFGVKIVIQQVGKITFGKHFNLNFTFRADS